MRDADAGDNWLSRLQARLTRADDTARSVGRVAQAGKLAARTLLSLDTNPVPADWTHVTKVDPEDAKKLPLLYPLYLRHSSAVSVGGSADVTVKNTKQTFSLLEPASVPVFHEPSGPRHVTRASREQAEFLAIPEVLNGDSESLVGQLGAGVEHIREELAPELLREKVPILPESVEDKLAEFLTSWLLSEAIFEAYIIQNPDSAAAREANVEESDLLSPAEAKRHAMAAECHLGSELVYLEYSGTYGGEEATEILDAISAGTSWSRLWYGGGIDSRESATAMLDAGADAVVVGDVFHRVADEEVELCSRALDDLGNNTDGESVREWVAETVEIGDSAAASYLSTIPSVTDPESVAQQYLVATVQTWLDLHAVADENEATSETELRRTLRAGETSVLPDATSDLDAGDTELVRRGLLALLAEHTDVAGFEATRTHLGLSLS
ncbi:geranylgeranylglyceryl/heptaprenylglyceryl phosphate synthase [Halorussus halophilus]|uniref:geranylgeranylglyceryl/heptaprenylglyceryl phosphate synthase n=1 Tax=Halorussus halophilus TaxID=2650975 RepID=UPI0013012410|nr:geranylgeranylglyceryl/heptaprenylglyceryl phosphate synthase [Halorussus halophilus]